MEKKGVEDVVMSIAPDANYNNEDIYNDTIIDDSGSLTSIIDPLQDKITEIEGVDAETEVVENGSRVTINADFLPPKQK